MRCIVRVLLQAGQTTCIIRFKRERNIIMMQRESCSWRYHFRHAHTIYKHFLISCKLCWLLTLLSSYSCRQGLALQMFGIAICSVLVDKDEDVFKIRKIQNFINMPPTLAFNEDTDAFLAFLSDLLTVLRLF